MNEERKHTSCLLLQYVDGFDNHISISMSTLNAALFTWNKFLLQCYNFTLIILQCRLADVAQARMVAAHYWEIRDQCSVTEVIQRDVMSHFHLLTSTSPNNPGCLMVTSGGQCLWLAEKQALASSNIRVRAKMHNLLLGWDRGRDEGRMSQQEVRLQYRRFY